MSAEILEAAARFYRAFAARDPKALLDTLATDFRGSVSEGMPNALGGIYHGPHAMLRECWQPLHTLADVRAIPDEYLPVASDRVVVIGHYCGTVRISGTRLRAAFAHVLRVEEGRIRELVQVTDTGLWRDALVDRPEQAVPGDTA